MKRFIIERDIPAAGQKPLSEIRATAKVSNDVMAELAPKIQWDHSYVAGDKIYCVYLAEDASVVEAQRHSLHLDHRSAAGHRSDGGDGEKRLTFRSPLAPDRASSGFRGPYCCTRGCASR